MEIWISHSSGIQIFQKLSDRWMFQYLKAIWILVWYSKGGLNTSHQKTGQVKVCFQMFPVIQMFDIQIPTEQKNCRNLTNCTYSALFNTNSWTRVINISIVNYTRKKNILDFNKTVSLLNMVLWNIKHARLFWYLSYFHRYLWLLLNFFGG